MSFFMQKHAIETKSMANKNRRGRCKNAKNNPSAHRICRLEELEKREYLAADPISVGVVYTEQYVENLGDKFYVAWVGGEDGCTTLDTLVINLDKNQNGLLDEGEAYFDTAGSGEVYSYVPFTLVSKTDDIGYSYEVEDGGMVLTISFTNFHAGDSFIFCIDLDEYQSSSINNAQVEGGEMGGSIVGNLNGSYVSAVFSSTHYQTADWNGMFVDYYDIEYDRSEALNKAYDRALLPFDVDDGNEGIAQAGVYDKFDLSPKPIIVSGYVYADHDVDCEYEPETEDSPLSNVQITLISENGQTWTTTTDIDGYYEFNSRDLMPGHYEIVSQANVVANGYTYADFCAKGGEFGERITPLQIDVKGMQGGDIAPNNNFAKVLPSSISGYVFEDRNNADGKNDGENWNGIDYPALIELYRVTLDANGKTVYTLMETTTVDANGYYEFSLDCSYNKEGTMRKLPGRTYEIREIFSSPDYADGKDYVGTLGGVVKNDVITNIFVGYDEHGVHYDFGELKLGSIIGNVYEDRNDNGSIDSGESGIAGVIIDLYQWDGSRYVWIAETQTDTNGSYEFNNLNIIYDYAIKERQPEDYVDGKDSIGTLGGKIANDYIYDVKVGWDQHGSEYNFGELKLGSIAGNVFEDRNDNGAFDSNESGIENVIVELYQWNGSVYEKIRETITDKDGAYFFDKLDISKEYAVKEKQPEGYTDGKDSIGSLGGVIISNDEIRSIDVLWDNHGINYNFGELKLGSISGYVYHDANNNGRFEEGEEPIEGVEVQLFYLDGDAYVFTGKITTTDRNGFYKFDGLDINRTYAIKEVQPKDWNDGRDTVGTLGGDNTESDFLKAVQVLWDQHGENYNFGELVPVGSLSGYVYEDDNDNGVKDSGEKGIANVTVQLYEVEKDGTATLVTTQITDVEGFYKFDNLTPKKTYIIREIQPSEYYDGKDAIGKIFGEIVGKQTVNDEFSDVLLPNNGEGVHYDFGELQPGSLSGYVYEDNNDNGIKEAGEAGIPNVTVTLWILNESTGLYENTGKTVKTNADGYYIFDKLQPGKIYRIVENQPAGYKDGKDTIGSLGGDVANDIFSKIPVAPAAKGVDYNFGELKSNPEKNEIPPAIPPTRVVPPTNLWGAVPTNFPYIYYQPTIPGSMTTLYGGGGFVESSSWHLSTLNDAIPKNQEVAFSEYGFRRDIQDGNPVVAWDQMHNGESRTVGLQNVGLSTSTESYDWILIDIKSGGLKKYKFGKVGKPIIGDWNGDGKDYIGIFENGRWYLDRDGDGKWDSDDIMAELGTASDQPVSGDWDGDGKIDIGVFGTRWEYDSVFINVEKGLPADLKVYTVGSESTKVSENYAANEELFKREDLISDDTTRKLTRLVSKNGVAKRFDILDHVFEYGAPGDIALTGDWTGDGRTKIGVYRNGEWFLDMDGDGKWTDQDIHVRSNVSSEYLPVVGDFNGDGVDTLGYYARGTWLLDIEGDGNFSQIISPVDSKDATPLVGDWDGDGRDEVGLHYNQQTVDNEATSQDMSTNAYYMPDFGDHPN